MLGVCSNVPAEHSSEATTVPEATPQRFSFVPLSRKVLRYFEHDYSSNSVPFFSVEFFPPRTANGSGSWVRLLDRYREGDPFFCDITWHVSGNPGLETPTSSITVAGVALNYCCHDTMLHIICIGLTKNDLRRHLDRAKRLGIRNILALRGDRHEPYETHDFVNACELVAFIRHEYGQYFTIVVAGYPIPHPEAINKQEDLLYLKRKVDAGADFIISQMFFEADDFINFVRDCRRIGIHVPIIPGICAINSFDSVAKFAQLSSVPLPERLIEALEPIKSNIEAVRNYGVHFLTDLCSKLIKAKVAPGLHFYTLNNTTVIRILRNLGLWKKPEIRVLPWRCATNHRRLNEVIRPVFWANRPKSYIHRSHSWHEYPCDVWSGKFSAKIDRSLTGFYEFFNANSSKQIREFLGYDYTVQDVHKLFHTFYSTLLKKDETNLILPWVEEFNRHNLEVMFTNYGQYILQGMLVINYLPRLNSLRSEDACFGWGESNGYIYQKEYLEFFLHPSYYDKLLTLLENYKGISYYLTDLDNTRASTNWPAKIPIIVTWGLFPNYQLIPAYVADHQTLHIWREEAYSFFDCWSDSEPSLTLIELKKYLLVSLIDNQFVSPPPTLDSPSTFACILAELFHL